jgi:hypothetical protein
MSPQRFTVRQVQFIVRAEGGGTRSGRREGRMSGQRGVRALLSGLLVGLAAAQGLPAAEKVLIETPLVSPQSAEASARVGGLLDRAAATVDRLYGDNIRMVARSSGEGALYSLATVASLDNDIPAIVITLTRLADGKKSSSLSWWAPWAPDQPLWLARAISLLWSSFHGFALEESAEKPVLADELSASLLNPTMPPLGIAVEPNGNVAVALLMSCVVLDSSFRPAGQAGKALEDKGVLYYAGGVAATPGGSLLLKPNGGRDLYRLQPDAPEPQRLPTGLELASIYYWTALADGSALLVDSTNKKAYRVAPGKKRQDMPLFLNPSSWPTAYAAGPDGSIWVFDPLLKGVRLFTAEGNPADIILPLLDPERSLVPTSMAVGPDGSFMMLSNGQLLKFRRDGRLLWEMGTLPGAEQDSLPQTAQIAVDWPRGLIYLADLTGRRIIKLLDRAYCREKGIHNDLEEKVVALREGGDDTGTAIRIAELYDSAGSPYMARTWWQKVQDRSPGSQKAASRLLALELVELKEAARDLDAKARLTLAKIGIESARPLSAQAIAKYELILSKSPGDDQARNAMTGLKELFSDKGPREEKKKPITITIVRMANLFPSLMQWYLSHPAGAVSVTNTLGEPLEKVRVRFLIPRFMDLPVESKPLARLQPGESATFDLSPVFSQKVLELQEDLAVQGQVVVTYLVDGAEQTASVELITTIYRNTALTWDDTRKISSFVTPREETVSGFAARVVAAGESGMRIPLSRKIFQAMRVCDALGAYGIAYVEDPDSPVSRSLGKAEIVDTVRFPRVTLYNRTGDCDDTTALLASLLESVGIRTAILTAPGHIFLAFDTGEPAENAQYLTDGAHDALARGGSAWIPVETTLLSKGFMTAWASATELVRRFVQAGPFEFIPLAGMRDSFPALPLAASSIIVAEPAKASVDKAYAASMGSFTDSLYASRVRELDGRLATLSGRQATLVRLREGILHALFGRMNEAESSFRKAISEDPTLTSPYVNLANLRLLADDAEGALQIVRQGLARNSQSALLNLLAARIYSARGDSPNTAASYARLKAANPDLAARFLELSGGAAAQRAAQPGEKPSVIWNAEQ